MIQSHCIKGCAGFNWLWIIVSYWGWKLQRWAANPVTLAHILPQTAPLWPLSSTSRRFFRFILFSFKLIPLISSALLAPVSNWISISCNFQHFESHLFQIFFIATLRFSLYLFLVFLQVGFSGAVLYGSRKSSLQYFCQDLGRYNQQRDFLIVRTFSFAPLIIFFLFFYKNNDANNNTYLYRIKIGQLSLSQKLLLVKVLRKLKVTKIKDIKLQHQV